jgi:hypothetical protein
MKTHFQTFSIKRSLSALFLVAASILLLSMNVRAQCPATELVSGLREPLGTALTNQGNLLVSENGTTELHSGRISIVNPANGNRRTLLDGIPCGISDVNEPSGAHGIVMRGRTLYVTIGTGDVGRAGPIPGTTIPNPSGASSPIFSSVLAIHFSAAVEKNTSGFYLTTANQQAIADGQTVTLSNGGGDKITIQLVVNFPDYVPFPLPFFPENIQLSNPFGIDLVANKLYVTDGGRNLTWQVDINSGSYSELVSFPGIPNPLFPTFGGPFLEAVPTGIASSNNKILVTLFRGFPFPPGTSTVQQIDPKTGDNNVFIAGLRGAIGIMPLQETVDTDYLVLQHNSGGAIFPPFTGPGLLLHFESPTDPPALVADCFVRPTSMTLDKKSGKMYVSEHAGRVVVLDVSSTLEKTGISSEIVQTDYIPAEIVLEQNFPNPFNPSTTIKFALPEKSNVILTVFNMIGEKVKDLFAGEMESGYHQINFDAANLPSGVYVYKISAGNFTSSKKMLLIK